MSAVAIKSTPFAGWIAEWAFKPKHCFDACADALQNFSLDLVGIVVGYLRKTNLFGLKEIQDGYGQAELEAAAQGPVYELPPPDHLDALLQTDLTQIFKAEACVDWAPKRKVTEVFSVYFKPGNLSVERTDLMVRKRGIHLSDLCHYNALLEHGYDFDLEACWILFPDEPTGLKKTFGLQQELIPAGCQTPMFRDAFYCICTRFVCSKIRIYGQNPNKNTRLLEQTEGLRLTLGNSSDKGLMVSPMKDSFSHYILGIAPMWKFVILNTSKSP